ncbi:MAG: tetratricopeptide repeat protein [Gemmatimonadota bacterium]|nr:tetratricopeptide repeat protein [Gemmatimonadota bacterium]
MVYSSLKSMYSLLIVLIVGLSGCASGGGSSGGGSLDVDALIAEARDVEQGVSPRNTPNTDAAADHLDAGQDANTPAEARNHYQLALTSAEAAIAEDPGNPLAHRMAALADLSLENYQSAGEHFDRAEELRPIYQFEDVALKEDAYITQYQLASPLLSQGAYAEAAVHLENASAVYKGRPEATITLAQIYAALRQHDQAIEKIDEVQAFLASEALEDIDDETAANWRAQAEGFPLMKAQVLADAGRFEEAAAEYRMLVAASPNDLELQQDLGAILIQMGDTPAGLEVYTGLLGRPGLDADGLSRIGLGFYQAEDFPRAASALQRAADASPMDRDALEWWARALLAQSEFAAVPPVANRWLELDPQSQQGYAILAQATNESGDTQGAAAAVQAVSSLQFSVDNLQMRRGPDRAEVSGGVTNKTMAPGSNVTLVFTFYAENGNALGTVNHTVALGAQGMSEVFQLTFDSASPVGGYGYTVGG